MNLRRTFAWCGAAAISLLAAAPAQAAPAVEVEFHDVTVGFGTDGVTRPIWLNTERDELNDLVVTIDTGKVTNVAVVKPDTGSTGCQVSAGEVRCDYASVQTWRPPVRLAIAPASQAKVGATCGPTLPASSRSRPATGGTPPTTV